MNFLQSILSRMGLVDTLALQIFTYQFSTLLKGALPLHLALNFLFQTTTNPSIRRSIRLISQDIRAGHSLSLSMARQKNLFDEVAVSLVESAMNSGNLPGGIMDLSNYYGTQTKMRRMVVNALLLPIIIILFGLALIYMFLVVGIPLIKEAYRGLNVKVTSDLQAVIDLSDYMNKMNLSDAIPFILGGIGVVTVFFYMTAPIYAELVQFVTQRISLLKYAQLQRFIRVLWLQYSNGVPFIDSLMIAGNTSGNKYFISHIKSLVDDINTGISIAESFRRRHPLFPDMVVEMIASGEKSSDLINPLEELSLYLESIVEQRANNMAIFLNTFSMFAVGSAIVYGIIGFFRPIISTGFNFQP